MKCIICHSDDIHTKDVIEEIHKGNDIVCITINIPVCSSCGERYYDRKTMKQLEKIQYEVAISSSQLSEIGKVLAYKN